MHATEVGKPYKEGKFMWPEFVEYTYTRAGHTLKVFSRELTRAEIADYKQGDAEFALFVKDGLMFLCYKFGSFDWSDASFTPHLVPDSHRQEPDVLTGDQRAVLQVILVEATTGIVKAIRMISLSPEFSRVLHNQIALIGAALPMTKREVDQIVGKIYNLFESKDMAKAAMIRCKGGE